MRKYYDVFPKWMSFAIVMIGIIMVMVVGWFWHHTQEATSNPIGQYNDRKMTEKIDQDTDKGTLPMTFSDSFQSFSRS